MALNIRDPEAQRLARELADATGETMTKPADKQVKFAIAKALKDVVNG